MGDLVKRFAQNRLGKDFVVGDVHGCFDQLQSALQQLGFDPEHDRVFAVGDLIDRGPRSVSALEWLAHSWFHSCLGNHEALMLESQQDKTAALTWMLNGGGWWLKVDENVRRQFIAAVSVLPLAMEVETAYGRIGIVHADVPEHLSWPEFVLALQAGERNSREIALWSRHRLDGKCNLPVEGIDRVVCGHTITPDRKIHIIANVWFIDTGAFMGHGGGLTVLPLEELFGFSSLFAGESTTP